jgi:hypothetical protein
MQRFLRQGSAMQWLWKIIELSVSDGVPLNSLIVAIVVGAILNLINQYGAIKGVVMREPDRPPFKWPAMLLTFCVPYCVATYGAVAVRLTAP